MNVRLKRAKELAGYAVQLTKEEGLPTMVKRGAGFVKRRCFGKRARYLPAKKVLEPRKNTCGNFWIPLWGRPRPTDSSALPMLRTLPTGTWSGS